MSKIEELGDIPIQPGVKLRILKDHSFADTSVDHKWTETCYDGGADTKEFEIPMHWHKYHDEIMVVKEGAFMMTLDGVTTRVEAGSEPIRIRARTRHGVKSIHGVKSVLIEKTDPTGDFKEWFFRDVFATGWPPSFLYTMRVFYDGDTYPAMPGNSYMLDEVFITIFGGLGKLFAPAKKPLDVLIKEAEDKKKP